MQKSQEGLLRSLLYQVLKECPALIDVVRMLESLASSSSVKLCVSSRPWNVFVESFGANVDRKLLLRDFTRDDVKKYVKDVLSGDSRFRRLEDKDDRCKDLIQEIVDIAQGVFLWISSAVRSLLRGLIDDNDITILQRRLDILPTQLEEYFQHMLEKIEDVY
jgi:hypothetical protein